MSEELSEPQPFSDDEMGFYRDAFSDLHWRRLVATLDRATERAEKAEERNKAIGEAMRQMIGLRNTYAVLERADSPEAD